MFGQPGTSESPREGVTITRDAYGVPSIRAGSDYDAWWGVGYAVAQDRLFQLEAFRRATSGRLAEVNGAGSLRDDVIARRDYYTDAEIQQQKTVNLHQALNDANRYHVRLSRGHHHARGPEPAHDRRALCPPLSTRRSTRDPSGSCPRS